MQKLKPDYEEVSPLKMIPLSLKLNPTVLDNMEAVRNRTRQNRNTYINLAIDVYNHYQRYKMMKKILDKESAFGSLYYFQIIKDLEEIKETKVTNIFDQ